jgi:hypothetical protein
LVPVLRYGNTGKKPMINNKKILKQKDSNTPDSNALNFLDLMLHL